MRKIKFLCVLLLVTSFAQAKSYRGTKTSFPALKPSHESLLQQNYVIDQQHWVRIRDERELSRAIDAGRLVNIPASETLTIATSLPANRRYVLPHVSGFLGQLSGDYYAVFGKPLQIDSAVRPVSVQTKLRRYNRNAAPAEGETASSHESGATVDFAKPWQYLSKLSMKHNASLCMNPREAILMHSCDAPFPWTSTSASHGKRRSVQTPSGKPCIC